MIRRWVLTTVFVAAAAFSSWPAGSPPAQAETGRVAPDLTKTNLFLIAGDYRRALESCQKAITDMPTVQAYVHLTYVYHAIDGYLEQLSQEERWTAVEQLYLNLAYREIEDLVDPPGGAGAHGERNDPNECPATVGSQCGDGIPVESGRNQPAVAGTDPVAGGSSDDLVDKFS